MHDIEPYYHWLNDYNSAEDVNSPFYNREYSEFYFANTIYNYYIHPLWDDFGSNTLYLKILYADYSEGFAILEFIGEWNDALGNDIMFLKREVIDALFEKDITKFICIGENILNFHYSDESYYEEMYEDLSDEGGWLVFLGLQQQHPIPWYKKTTIDHH